MKKIIPLLLIAITLSVTTEAQGLKGLINKAKDAVNGKSVGALSTDDIVSGLKEALVQGSQKGASTLSQVDGFFGNAALKILLPAEAQKVESTLRKIGLGKQVDDAILSMNRAAEDAAKSAAPIFVNAIKQMSFQDALGILKGGDTAATGYLRGKTNSELTAAFKPVIDQSLEKVNATKYWNTLITSYNKINILGQKVNPDLSAYVTDKALNGIFYQVALEEKSIREDPLARGSDILKKVFGSVK
ncbi:MAG: hypothetical protein JWQ30_1650 [Sediminibacterium sp.]|nr:hypothetical protein [Sediminibacterium sp.]